MTEDEYEDQEFDFSNAKQGPVVPPRPNSTLVTIRLDDYILDYFREKVDKAGGGSYPTMINDVLRDYIKLKDPNFKDQDL